MASAHIDAVDGPALDGAQPLTPKSPAELLRLREEVTRSGIGTRQELGQALAAFQQMLLTQSGDVHIRCQGEIVRVEATESGRAGIAARIARYEFIPATATAA